MNTRLVTMILLFVAFLGAGLTPALSAQDLSATPNVLYLTPDVSSITLAMIAGGCANGTGLDRFAHFSEVRVGEEDALVDPGAAQRLVEKYG